MSLADLNQIADTLDQEEVQGIHSISLSYNSSITDEGLINFLKVLPSSVREIGLVSCNLGDTSGAELLNYIKSSEHLHMVCAEQNNFSPELRKQFKQVQRDRPGLMLIV